jgi:AAHS family 4-hydroxybenzoate transporter-like MFS transporter
MTLSGQTSNRVGAEQVPKHDIDVGQLVDKQGINAFNVMVLVVIVLSTALDGYDIFVPGFIAPALIKQWHVNPAELGSMFGIGMIGIILGAPLFGWLGDRYGRKRMIVLCSVFYGLVSLLSLAATSMTQFTAMRFIIGIGIGGLIPNAIALTAEFTPIKYRSMFIMLATLGVPVGQLLPGLVTASLVPAYGWHVLLIVGGACPILVGLLAQFTLPESIKYLVLRTDRVDEVRRIVQSIQPGAALPKGARFVIPEPLFAADLSPAKLFAGELKFITPLVWFCLATVLLSLYFTVSWMLVVLEAAGLTPQQAAVRAIYFALGGVFGGLIFTPLVHRFGVAAVAFGFIVVGPLVACIGISGLSTLLISAFTACAGFFIIGIINGMEAIMGMLYPTAARSKGVGWGLAVGRIGSLIGPVLGAYLVGLKLTNFQLFLTPAAILVFGALLFLVLAALCTRRFGGVRLNDEAAIHGATIMGEHEGFDRLVPRPGA